MLRRPAVVAVLFTTLFSSAIAFAPAIEQTADAATSAGISVVKSANVTSFSAAGTLVTYSYKVTNTGSVTLNSVAVTDPMTGLSAVSCPSSTLTSGSSETCTATYSTTTSDVKAGSISNTGTAKGTPSGGSQVTATSSLLIPEGVAFACSPPTDFLSQSNTNGSPTTLYSGTEGSGTVSYGQLGSTYSQTYNALGFDPVNDLLYATVLGGNTLLAIDSNGTVNSLGAISGYSSQSNAPADGAFDASGNYWITGGNGSTTAYEIDVNTSPPSVISTLSLSQSWDPIDFSLDGGYMWGLAGTTLYRLDLSSGTVTTFSAPSGVVSGNFGAAWTYGNGNLGFSNNGNGDIYEISVTNPSSASPSFGLVSSYTGPVAGQSNDGAACNGPVVQNTNFTISKTGPAVVAPSGTITWTITLTNNGPGASSGFSVSDPVPAAVTNVATTTKGCAVTGNNVLCSEGELGIGGTFTITLTGTAPSVSSGTNCVTNTASITPQENDSNPTTSSWTTCTASISLVKSATIGGQAAPPATFSAAGTTVNYSYKVTNTGGVTLNPVTVTDPMSGLSTISCPNTSLAAGASETCTATYVTTQADVDAGSISNTGTATGTPSSGSKVTATSSVTIQATQTSKLGLTKTDSLNGTKYTTLGQVVTYTLTATNSGNVDQTNVLVVDSPATDSALSCTVGGSGVANPDPDLAPGASMICTGTHKITQSDLDSGSYKDTATATSTQTPTPGVSASDTINANQQPALQLKKSADTSSNESASTTYNHVGQVVTYTYVVQNTGNITLAGPITIADDMLGTVLCPSVAPNGLAPQASITCSATYAITQADLDSGGITNLAVAKSNGTSSNTATATVTAIVKPSLVLVKSATIGGNAAPPATYSSVGQVVTYTYVVTNSGSVTLAGPVTVTDNKLSAVSCPSGGLAPGASMTCTATYAIKQSDLDNGSVTNIASAQASGVSSNNSTVTVLGVQTLGLTLVKTAKIGGLPMPPATFTAVGQIITYSYLVTNTGNVTFAGPVTVTDDKLANVACPSGSLAPGASITCTATYAIQQSDLTNGSITNIAVAHSNGFDSSASSPVTVSRGTTPVVAASKKVFTAPAAKATAVPEATTVHTGEPWGGSKPWVLLMLGLGGVMVLFGEVVRRRQRSRS